MAKQIKTFCDCCGAEITGSAYLSKYSFAENLYEGSLTTEAYKSGYKNFDICDECAEAFDTAIDNVFGEKY